MRVGPDGGERAEADGQWRRALEPPAAPAPLGRAQRRDGWNAPGWGCGSGARAVPAGPGSGHGRRARLGAGEKRLQGLENEEMVR